MQKTLFILIPLVVLGVVGVLFLTKSKTQKIAKISPTPSVALSKIRLGYLPKSTVRVLIAVADKKGFFKKNNLDVELQGVDSAIATTLVSKRVDVAIDPPLTFLLARANGADIVEVGEVTNDFSFLLLSYKEPQLIRTIGVPRIGGEPYLKVLEILKKLKINASSVTFQATGSGPASAALLKEGKIDAIMQSNLDWLTLKGQKFFPNEPKIVFDTSTDKSLRSPNIIVVDNDFLKKNPKIVESLSKALLEADNWIVSASDDDIVKVLSESDSLEKDRALVLTKVYKDSLLGLKFRPDMQRISEIANSLEEIKDKKFDPSTFVSNNIADSLQKSGFIK